MFFTTCLMLKFSHQHNCLLLLNWLTCFFDWEPLYFVTNLNPRHIPQWNGHSSLLANHFCPTSIRHVIASGFWEKLRKQKLGLQLCSFIMNHWNLVKLKMKQLTFKKPKIWIVKTVSCFNLFMSLFYPCKLLLSETDCELVLKYGNTTFAHSSSNRGVGFL